MTAPATVKSANALPPTRTFLESLTTNGPSGRRRKGRSASVGELDREDCGLTVAPRSLSVTMASRRFGQFEPSAAYPLQAAIRPQRTADQRSAHFYTPHN